MEYEVIERKQGKAWRFSRHLYNCRITPKTIWAYGVMSGAAIVILAGLL